MWKEEYLEAAKKILNREGGVAYSKWLNIVTENVKAQGHNVVLVEGVQCYTRGKWGDGQPLRSTPPERALAMRITDASSLAEEDGVRLDLELSIEHGALVYIRP